MRPLPTGEGRLIAIEGKAPTEKATGLRAEICASPHEASASHSAGRRFVNWSVLDKVDRRFCLESFG
jgi:hypothetical protein